MGKGLSDEHFNIKVQPITDIKHDLYSGRMQAGGPALAFCQHKMHRHKLLPASFSVRAHPSALIIYVCEPFSLSIEIVNIIQFMVESTNLDVCLCKIYGIDSKTLRDGSNLKTEELNNQHNTMKLLDSHHHDLIFD